MTTIAPAAWAHASGCNGDDLLSQAVSILWLLSLAAGTLGLLFVTAASLFRIGGPWAWRLTRWSLLLAMAVASIWLLAWANLASMMGCISLPERSALALLNMLPAEGVRRLAGHFRRSAQARFADSRAAPQAPRRNDPGPQ